MGADATAYLFFGVDFGDSSPATPRTADGEVDEESGEHEDFDPGDIEPLIAARAGIVNHADEIDTSEYDDRTKPEFRGMDGFNNWLATPTGAAWNKAHDEYKTALKPLVEACPIEIVSYGYMMDGDYNFALALTGTRMRHGWDRAAKVDLPFVDQRRVPQAKKWLTDHGIVVPKIKPPTEYGEGRVFYDWEDDDAEGLEQDWAWRLTASYG